MMDVLMFVLGLVLGVVAVGIAMELGVRRVNRTSPATLPTHKWSLQEISNPRIIAENMGAIELPKNAKIVVNEFPDRDMFSGMEVKRHSGIRGNFILGDDRALILSGPIQENELGIWTVEKDMLRKLNKYFEDSWAKASPLFPDEPSNERAH
jgi:hypothetical protein